MAGPPIGALSKKGAPAKPPLRHQAILVVHGIGRQRPYQVLDNFTRGIFAALKTQNEIPTVTHLKLGPQALFDHAMHVESKERLNLDIYEYYWASKTQGKASFLDIAKWIVTTALEPLRRFAFNITLLIERAGDSRRRLAREILREAWRAAYIFFMFTAIAVGATLLVTQSSILGSKLFSAIKVVAPQWPRWQDIIAAVVFLGALGVLLAIVFSLPEQIRDLVLVKRWLRDRKYTVLQSVPPKWLTRASQLARFGNAPLVGPVISGLAKAAQGALDEQRVSKVVIPSRVRLLYLSALMVVILVTVLTIFWWWPSPFVHDVFRKLGRPGLLNLGWMVGLLGAGVLLKRVFVDYIGDVALYVTADENSEFYATRIEILTEATRKLKWLLQQDKYAAVAVAGHSLGSVIAYDAISWLRVESQRPQAVAAKDAAPAPISAADLNRLKAFVTFGSPLNKVVYFFRDKLPRSETVRTHILNELHGFRRHSEPLISPEIRDDPPFNPPDAMRWLNVYSPMDPVSARLIFFRDVVERRRWYWFWGMCHTDYWHDPVFYRDVLTTICG
jgi:hypothetical protein